MLSDGTLFGSNWVQMPDQRVTGDSILARERQLAEYTTKLDEHVAATAALRDEVDSARANLKAEELAEHEISEALDALGRQISTQREQLSQMEAELKEYAENVGNFYNHLVGMGIPPDHACAITSSKVHAEGRD